MVDALHAMTGMRREQESETLENAFHKMTLERRQNEANKNTFLGFIHERVVEERMAPSMVDAFTAMALE